MLAKRRRSSSLSTVKWRTKFASFSWRHVAGWLDALHRPGALWRLHLHASRLADRPLSVSATGWWAWSQTRTQVRISLHCRRPRSSRIRICVHVYICRLVFTCISKVSCTTTAAALTWHHDLAATVLIYYSLLPSVQAQRGLRSRDGLVDGCGVGNASCCCCGVRDLKSRD